MRRLLEIAERLCGVHARNNVFEPLAADWQRELILARPRGRTAYVRTLISGALAFIRSTVMCADVVTWVPPPRTALHGVATLVVAAVLPLGIPIAGRAVSGSPLEVGSIRTLASMAFSANLYFPPAAMLALFVIRRDPRLLRRHALLAIFSISVIGTGLAFATSNDAVRRYFSTPEWFEREYQRAVMNDLAGRVQYPGTAVRQIRAQSFEQRRIGYERVAAMAQSRSEDRPSWRRSARQFQPVALAVVLAVMGWRLATVARPTFARAGLWWLLMVSVTMTTTRWPSGATLALVSAFTGLLFVSVHRHDPAPIEITT